MTRLEKLKKKKVSLNSKKFKEQLEFDFNKVRDINVLNRKGIKEVVDLCRVGTSISRIDSSFYTYIETIVKVKIQLEIETQSQNKKLLEGNLSGHYCANEDCQVLTNKRTRRLR